MMSAFSFFGVKILNNFFFMIDDFNVSFCSISSHHNYFDFIVLIIWETTWTEALLLIDVAWVWSFRETSFGLESNYVTVSVNYW